MSFQLRRPGNFEAFNRLVAGYVQDMEAAEPYAEPVYGRTDELTLQSVVELDPPLMIPPELVPLANHSRARQVTLSARLETDSTDVSAELTATAMVGEQSWQLRLTGDEAVSQVHIFSPPEVAGPLEAQPVSEYDALEFLSLAYRRITGSQLETAPDSDSFGAAMVAALHELESPQGLDRRTVVLDSTTTVTRVLGLTADGLEISTEAAWMRSYGGGTKQSESARAVVAWTASLDIQPPLAVRTEYETDTARVRNHKKPDVTDYVAFLQPDNSTTVWDSLETVPRELRGTVLEVVAAIHERMPRAEEAIVRALEEGRPPVR